jgi:hypothetical protein
MGLFGNWILDFGYMGNIILPLLSDVGTTKKIREEVEIEGDKKAKIRFD